jgi:cellobiose dehydrogenase (acceptor)
MLSLTMLAEHRSGILAQVAPNLGPMFWQQINGSDGVVRHIQWQARIEGRTNSTTLFLSSISYCR